MVSPNSGTMVNNGFGPFDSYDGHDDYGNDDDGQNGHDDDGHDGDTSGPWGRWLGSRQAGERCRRGISPGMNTNTQIQIQKHKYKYTNTNT